MAQDPITEATNSDILTQLLLYQQTSDERETAFAQILKSISDNQQDFRDRHVALKEQTALILQTNRVQEAHLLSLNGAVKENQQAIMQNSKGVAVALAQVESNKSNLALMWRIMIPVSATLLGAGISAGLALLLM